MCVCLCTLSPQTAAQHCIYDSFTDTTRRVEREKGGSEGDTDVERVRETDMAKRKQRTQGMSWRRHVCVSVRRRE